MPESNSSRRQRDADERETALMFRDGQPVAGRSTACPEPVLLAATAMPTECDASSVY